MRGFVRLLGWPQEVLEAQGEKEGNNHLGDGRVHGRENTAEWHQGPSPISLEGGSSVHCTAGDHKQTCSWVNAVLSSAVRREILD